MTEQPPPIWPDTTIEDAKSPGHAVWVSRTIVVAFFVWIIGFFGYALIQSTHKSENTTTVISPFKPWDGAWEGDMVVTNPNGEEIYRAHFHTEFRHVQPKVSEGMRARPGVGLFRQEEHIQITDPKTGKVELEKALYTAEFNLTKLNRRTYRRNGNEAADHQGKIVNGHIIWSRSIPKIQETFDMWVEGDACFVKGEGIYGDPASPEKKIFNGRYQRVK